MAAIAYAPIVSLARKGGRLISVADGQIAAIAAVHGLTVATRDTAPFIAAGVPVTKSVGKGIALQPVLDRLLSMLSQITQCIE